MKFKQLLTKTLLVAAGLCVGATSAWATDVPTPVYFNDFSSDAGLTIVGSGEFINDGDAHFGRIYHNNPNNSNAVRTNYLTLPSTVFSAFNSTGGKTAMSIGFWVNVKNTTGYTFCPLFAAYNSAPTNVVVDEVVTGTSNTMPMLVLEARGLVQWNCNGYFDTGIFTNSAEPYNDGTPYNSVEWLEDSEWHYYTLVLTSTTAKVYVDGVLKNGWTVDGTSAGQKISGLFTDAATNLTYVCLGGNQAWDWDDKDSAFGFDDFAVYDAALTPEQIAQIVYDKLNNTPIATSVTANGADTAEKEYVKYEFNAWTNAHEYVGGGTAATYGGTAGTGDSKGWATNTIGRQIRVTFNHALEAGDVITVNAACSYAGTDNRCPVGIATYANNDIKTKKYLTLRFPTDGYTAKTNYNLSYTVTANDSLCGKSELYIGGHNGTGGSIYFYFKSVKVTSNNSAAAYAPQTLSTAKTWTFEGLTTGSRTEGAMMDGYLFIGADATHAVGVVEDSKTINSVAYTKALDFATTNNNNNITNGVNTNVAGCIMLKVPAGYGKIKVVGRNIGTNTTFFYNIGQTSRVNVGNFYSNGTDTKTIIYNVSESKPIIIYQGKSYDDSEIYIYSVSWEPLTVEATIGATGWTTLASAYPLDLSSMTTSTGEVTAYYASAVGASSVTMTSTESSAVAAGEGLMLKGTAGATITIPAVLSGTAIDGNKLVGCPTATELTTPNANYYVLVSNEGTAEFQNLSGSYTDNKVTIPAGKAYLDASGSGAKSLTIVFDNETLGISDAARLNGNAEGMGEKTIYNLSGQRIAAPQKGINIIGGRKVVVK